jgi:hypothetical protein
MSVDRDRPQNPVRESTVFLLAVAVARRRGATIALAYAEWLLGVRSPAFDRLVKETGAYLLANLGAPPSVAPGT